MLVIPPPPHPPLDDVLGAQINHWIYVYLDAWVWDYEQNEECYKENFHVVIRRVIVSNIMNQ